MKKIEISDEQISEAQKLYEFDELNNSITKGKSNIYGALGEIIVRDYFLANNFVVDFTSTYEYDMIVNNYKIDVKTKKTSVEPKDHYNCSISNSNIKQKTNYYFFVRITEDLKTGYLLGYILKNNFFRKATFNKKGEKDGNFFFKDDCYNLKIGLLNKFK